MDLLFSVSHDGMKHAFELAHLFLTQPDFDPKAFARAQKNSIIDVNKIEKDVESIAFDNLIKASLGVFGTTTSILTNLSRQTIYFCNKTRL